MRMELVDIVLRSHSLSMDKDFFPALVDSWDAYALESMASITSWSVLPDMEQPSLVRFVQSVGLRWVHSEDGEERIAAPIDAQYGLLFSTEVGLQSLAIDELISERVISSVWPYWRQDFAQMAMKASLPMVVIPPDPDFSLKS